MISRISCALLLLATAAGVLFGETFDLTTYDFTNSYVSFTETNKLQVHSVQKDGKNLSYFLELQRGDDVNFWQISRSEPVRTLWKKSVNTQYVNFKAASPSVLEMSGILIGDALYTARFLFDGESRFNSLEFKKMESAPDSVKQAAQSLQDLTSTTNNEQLLTEIQDLETKIALLTATVESMEKTKEDNQFLRSQLISLQRKYKELEVVQKELETIRSKSDTLTANLLHSQEEADMLNLANTEKEKLILQMRKEIENVTSKMETLNREQHRELRKVSVENEQLRESNEYLAAQIQELMKYPSIPGMLPALDVILLEGFQQGAPLMGSWHVEENLAQQNDDNQYFAELVFPVVQQEKPTLFSFRARAVGNSWVGFGMHLFVSENEWKKGYGLGSSLLIWFTRDEETYGEEYTHLQIYRSSNAVWMEQLLDSQIAEKISEFMDIKILYHPELNYIVVSVNDEEKLRYRTWFRLDSGMEISLRTLKSGISFKDLAVRTVQ